MTEIKDDYDELRTPQHGTLRSGHKVALTADRFIGRATASKM
jgi:hypothetical protein